MGKIPKKGKLGGKMFSFSKHKTVKMYRYASSPSWNT